MRGRWQEEWAEEGRAPGPKTPATSSAAAGLFAALLEFFQEVISPVDGSRCPSYPTCSAYSRQAYQKHGALLGTLMTVDRLIHEVSEEHYAPVIEVGGVRRIYDPLSANEFWKHNNSTRRNPLLRPKLTDSSR